MLQDKPFSQSCENNKGPILVELKRQFSQRRSILEIGSGTGQHSVFFAPALAHLTWQTSDMPANHQGIHLWHHEEPAANLLPPLQLTIGQDPWPDIDADGVYTANTTHIMQVEEARLMMELVAESLPSGGIFCQYGPFNIDGAFTSDSNQQFNQHLLQQGYGGIRDISELKQWAGPGLTLAEQVSMPANNLLLCWHKQGN